MGLYLVAAVVWITLSGGVAAAIANATPLSLATIELAKGLLFVAVTGLVLRSALRRWARRLAAAAAAQRQADANLHEVARVRETFLRGTSHELRTPLTNIIGFGLTLQSSRDRLDSQVAEQLIDRLVANARRLERLVLDLLDLDRLTPGVDAVVSAPIRLDRMLRGVLMGLPATECTVEMRADEVVVTLDAAKTERIVDELVRNAIRHTPPGTHVWVSAACDAGAVRLVVEDDGPGIDRALWDAIFEPFTQGMTAGESSSPGLGIGLALVSRYAAVQGGTVTAGARSGGGARFEVTIPSPAADRPAEPDQG